MFSFMLFGVFANAVFLHIMYIFSFDIENWEWNLLLHYWGLSLALIGLWYFFDRETKRPKHIRVYTARAYTIMRVSTFWYMCYCILICIKVFLSQEYASQSIEATNPHLYKFLATLALVLTLGFVGLKKNLFLVK